MEVVQKISLTPGCCGKIGRCYEKNCEDISICGIGFKVTEYNTESDFIETKVHKQWE